MQDEIASQNSQMKISILASGSSGNVTYIESPKQKLLIDAGLSGKKISDLLASINRNICDLDSVVVTHEHRDHVAGVGVLARKYNIDVYANEKTWDAMDPIIGKVPVEQKHIFDMGKIQTIGDIDVESFGVSHDAIAPQFYSVNYNQKTFVVLTDTGYVSDRILGTIEDADGYLIESNHDTEMLRMGRYPWHLKQRILSDKGHLSNTDGALALTDIIGNRTKRVYLGHLSKDNNLKELAHLTVDNVLKEHDLPVTDFGLYDTDPDKATSLFQL